MIKGSIEFTSETLDGVREAVEEALDRIASGHTSGFDSNKDEGFSFSIEDDALGVAEGGGLPA